MSRRLAKHLQSPLFINFFNDSGLSFNLSSSVLDWGPESPSIRGVTPRIYVVTPTHSHSILQRT
jgi:hypothetical protein